MKNTIHDIGVARQIGEYSDAIEASAAERLLFLSETPGLTKDGRERPLSNRRSKPGKISSPYSNTPIWAGTPGHRR
jgi:hypothetical protein